MALLLANRRRQGFGSSRLQSLAANQTSPGQQAGPPLPAEPEPPGIQEGLMRISTWPNSTGVPFSTRISTTSPLTSDSSSFISFIASRMQTG
jgi:hypothetical protein